MVSVSFLNYSCGDKEITAVFESKKEPHPSVDSWMGSLTDGKCEREHFIVNQTFTETLNLIVTARRKKEWVRKWVEGGEVCGMHQGGQRRVKKVKGEWANPLS